MIQRAAMADHQGRGVMIAYGPARQAHIAEGRRSVEKCTDLTGVLWIDAEH